MDRLPDLSSLSHDEKDALIHALWAQVQALTAQVGILTARVPAAEVRRQQSDEIVVVVVGRLGIFVGHAWTESLVPS